MHVGEARQEAVQQFIGDRGLARAAGTGDADDRRGAARQLPFLAQARELGFIDQAVLDGREHPADLDLVVELHLVRHVHGQAAGLGALDHVLDHLHQAHLHAVVGVVDALDAVVLQLADFLRRDRAAAAAEHADMAGAAFFEHVHHVLEVLDVAALVAGQRDAVGVFLQRGPHHVLHRAVVAEVDDFRALPLDQPAHDVDGGVMAIEQAGGGDEAQRAALGGGFRCVLLESGGSRRTHARLFSYCDQSPDCTGRGA